MVLYKQCLVEARGSESVASSIMPHSYSHFTGGSVMFSRMCSARIHADGLLSTTGALGHSLPNHGISDSIIYLS